MSKVFVVNEPMRWSIEESAWVRAINLKPAGVHGEIVHLLPPGELPLNMDDTVEAIRTGLIDISLEDYIVLVGDPRAIAIAAAVATEYLDGWLRMLQWDRGNRVYRPIIVDTTGTIKNRQEAP